MPDYGLVESAQALLDSSERSWPLQELLDAAARAALKNTGWPIGLVLTRDELAPKPTDGGIEARLHRERFGSGPGWEDYWSLSRDGCFYVIRLFEEHFYEPSYQTSEGHPEKPVWFETRIWRIAELLLHSARLYRELGVSPDEPYLLQINHAGLTGREFWTNEASRFFSRGRISAVDEARWQREVTADFVEGNLLRLVQQVGDELFALFGFAEVAIEDYQKIVRDFRTRRM